MAPSQESPVTEEGERTQWLDELLPGEGELPTDTQPSEPEPTEWLGLPQDGKVTAEGMPPPWMTTPRPAKHPQMV